MCAAALAREEYNVFAAPPSACFHTGFALFLSTRARVSAWLWQGLFGRTLLAKRHMAFSIRIVQQSLNLFATDTNGKHSLSRCAAGVTLERIHGSSLPRNRLRWFCTSNGEVDAVLRGSSRTVTLKPAAGVVRPAPATHAILTALSSARYRVAFWSKF